MKYVLLAGFMSACTLAAQPKPGTGSIEGRVLNSLSGAPVRKASVALMHPQVRLSAETDAEGRFQFTALPPGTYKLTAKRAGFLDHSARRPIVIGDKENVSGAEIRLPPQGVISGRVVDEDGDPVGGARMTILKQGYGDGRKQWALDRNPNNFTTTSETGEFRFPNLAPGRYLVKAETQRFAPFNRYGEPPQMSYVPAYYPNALSEQSALPIEIGVGTEVRGIDIHLSKVATPAQYHVTGKVIGAPPGSVVGVYMGTARPPDYEFTMNLQAGQHTIVAHVYSDGPAAFAIENLTVNDNVTGLVLTMRPAPEITGRISVAESGSQLKLEGVSVTLRRQPVFFNDPAARSDGAGKFTFDKSVTPGRFSLDVNQRSLPEGCFVQKIMLGKQEISADGFEILTSAPLDIVLSNTAGTVAGSVADEDRKPFPTSIITLIPSDEKSRPVKQVADDEGNFKFTNLRPGKYKLFAWEEVDDGLWPDPDFLKNYEGRATEITVGPSETQNAQLRAIALEAMK